MTRMSKTDLPFNYCANFNYPNKPPTLFPKGLFHRRTLYRIKWNQTNPFGLFSFQTSEKVKMHCFKQSTNKSAREFFHKNPLTFCAHAHAHSHAPIRISIKNLSANRIPVITQWLALGRLFMARHVLIKLRMPFGHGLAFQRKTIS